MKNSAWACLRSYAPALILITLLGDVTYAQGLPQWTKQDWEKLQKGEIIPGSALLVDTPDEGTPTPVAPEEPEVVIPEVVEPAFDPEQIPQEYLLDYFVTANTGHLIDPQQLLSRQEGMDQRGFLDYHAKDSSIPIHFYLFDAQQKIPAPYSLQKLLDERYGDMETTCVVFYFLGDPSRSMISFGGKAPVSVEHLRKSREAALIKALEKSDPVDQVESFLVQLSISLYWLEKEQADLRDASAAAVAKKQADAQSSNTASAAGGSRAKQGAFAKLKPELPYLLTVASGFGCSLIALIFAWRMWGRSRRYEFPVIDLPSRLGADYGAGVGAVIAFHSQVGAPSSQREQVPDYMMRL
ncbi:MAG: hypothetical protein ACPG32_12145 [Akkermansiaceae bacterium]